MRLVVVALAALAGPVAAQGLGDEIVGLLRARDCSMGAAAVAEVFVVMGRAREEIDAAVDSLVIAGSATLLGGRLALAAEICQHVPERDRVPPLPWLEERLRREPGCGMALTGLREEAVGAGVPQADFDRAAADLSALGRLGAVGDAVRLRADLCAPGSPRDRQVDRILSLGRDSYRAVLGTLALERGCRLPLEDRDTLLAELMAQAAVTLFLGRDLSDEAGEALRLRMSEALDDPGPAYRIESGEVVARFCLPREPTTELVPAPER